MSYDPEPTIATGDQAPPNTGTFPYGWDGVTSTRSDGTPLPKGTYRKLWTHPPSTIIVGAPKRTGGKPVRYIVFPDQSLRRIDKVLRKQFASMTIEEQSRLVAAAAQRVEGV